MRFEIPGEIRVPSKVEGFAVWFTGLPASGKTTTARAIEPELRRRGRKVELLDAEETNKWNSPKEDFSRENREKALKRLAHICQILVRNGIVVVTTDVSPYRSSREYARKVIGNYVEAYLACPRETCMKRDFKGRYRLALLNKIRYFPGVQTQYEGPISPEIVIDTERSPPSECAQIMISRLVELGYLDW